MNELEDDFARVVATDDDGQLQTRSLRLLRRLNRARGQRDVVAAAQAARWHRACLEELARRRAADRAPGGRSWGWRDRY